MPKQVSLENQDTMVKLMNLFWMKGYMATTIHDLTKETGLSKSFLYSNFGKKGIFEEVFYYYLEHYTDPFLKALDDDPRGIEAIQEKMSFLAESLVNQTMPKACLFVNTVVEMGSKDPDIFQLNEMYCDRVKGMYEKKLRHCYTLGEIKNASYIPLYTNILLNLLYSLAVLYKVHTVDELDEFIASQLKLIT